MANTKREQVKQDALREALAKVLSIVSCYPDTWDEAVERIFDDYRGTFTRDELARYGGRS